MNLNTFIKKLEKKSKEELILECWNYYQESFPEENLGYRREIETHKLHIKRKDSEIDELKVKLEKELVEKKFLRREIQVLHTIIDKILDRIYNSDDKDI